MTINVSTYKFSRVCLEFSMVSSRLSDFFPPLTKMAVGKVYKGVNECAYSIKFYLYCGHCLKVALQESRPKVLIKTLHF